MKLTKDWIEFHKQIKTLILEGNEIAQKESVTIRDEKSFDSVKKELKDWVDCNVF